MKKTQTKNENRRLLRKVTDSTKNTGGVDPTAFESADDLLRERQVWVQKKAEFEKQLSIINSNIAQANRRMTVHRVKSDSWEFLHKRRAQLVEEKNECDRRLAQIKAIRIENRPNEQNSLAGAFMETAREVLAPDVFNKVLKIAILRAPEGGEK